jgi:hypothetical protein
VKFCFLPLIRAMAAALAVSSSLCVLPIAAVAQPGAGVTRDFLFGRWTDDGNCANVIDFLADGRFRLTAGGEGRWTLEGGSLTFIGNTTITARIARIDANTITLTHTNGNVGRSTRCLAAPRLSMPPVPGSVDEVMRISRPASANLLLGRWTDDGDCGVVIEFRRDGSFTTPEGSGRWSLEGSQLTFVGASAASATVRAVGNDRILLVHPNGSIGQSLRC